MKKLPAVPLAWGAALLISLLLGLAAVVLITGRGIERQAISIETDSVPGLIDGHTIRARYAEGFISTLLLLDADTAANRQTLLALLPGLDARARAACDDYERTIHIDPRQDTANYRRLLQVRDRFLDTRTQFIGLIESGRREEARQFLAGRLRPDLDALLQACEVLVAYNNRTGTIISAGLIASIAQMRWIVIGIIVVALVAGISLGANLVSRLRTERALLESEAKFSTAFQASPNVMVISRRTDGRIIAVNGAFNAFYEVAGQHVVGKPAIEVGLWTSAAERAEMLHQLERDARVRNVLRERVRADGRLISMLVSIEPIKVGNEEAILAVGHDITDRKRHEQEIERLNRLYQVLSRVNQALVRATTPADVFQEVCRALVDNGGFKAAWVGRPDPAARRLVPVEIVGDEFGYVRTLRVSIDPDLPEGRGPGGTAFREGRVYVCNDFLADPATLPWREAAERTGVRGSIALPLRRGTEVIGLLTVYAGEKDFFQSREIALLEEVAGDLSFALEVIAGREQHRKAEIALRESEEQFRSTMVNSAIGMAILSPEPRVIDANPALCRLFGRTREELIAVPPLSFTHPDDLVIGPGNFRRVLAGEIDSYWLEKRYFHKDGRVLWVNQTMAAVRDSRGQAIRLIMQVQDITERKQTLVQLAELTDRLRLALDIGRLGMWQHWPKTGQTVWDVRSYELFGVEKGAEPPTFEQLVTRVHPDDRAAFKATVETLIQSGREAHHHFRLLAPDGGCKEVEAHALVQRDAAGVPEWILGVNVDLTDVVTASTNAERYRAQLLQTQKMETLGQLAGGVAHDFNNFLTAINGFVELAALTLPAGHESTVMLEQAKRAAASARDLVRRILVFSRRAPAGARAPLRLCDTVRDTAPLVSTLLPANVSLGLELAAENAHVFADGGQIQQVLMNLCINACQAIGNARGTVKITVDSPGAADTPPPSGAGTTGDGHWVRLRVSDTGCGMDQATRSRIFEPFFTTKPEGEGTGLGLPIVQDIVQEHGGQIAIDSEVGRGTTFTLLFPTCGAPATSITGGMSAPPMGHADEVVLVLDDEPMIVALATTILKRAGYTVVAGTSASEAWRIFAADAGRFDLVLTDYAMSEMSGLEFVQRVHALVPDLPFIIMTGNAAQSGSLGGQGIRLVQKPFDVAELLKAVRERLQSEPVGRRKTD